MEILYFLSICGVIWGIVSLVKLVLTRKKDAEYETLMLNLVEDHVKMVISDIEHDHMVEFTEEQWENFLKESNPAKAAFCAIPKRVPPLEEFKEKLFKKGNQLLYGFGLDVETTDKVNALLKEEIDLYDEMCLGFLMKKINQTAIGEYAYMRDVINYDSTVSGVLYDVAERIGSEELKFCVLRHAEKKGWVNN